MPNTIQRRTKRSATRKRERRMPDAIRRRSCCILLMRLSRRTFRGSELSGHTNMLAPFGPGPVRAYQNARAKAAKCLAAFFPLAHRIFGNRDINQNTRLSQARSLCFSRLFFGAETWLAPSDEAVRIINAARLRILRQICQRCRFQATGHGPDAAVLAECGETPTDLVLLRMRLTSVFSAFRGGPQIFAALVVSESSFFPPTYRRPSVGA